MRAALVHPISRIARAAALVAIAVTFAPGSVMGQGTAADAAAVRKSYLASLEELQGKFLQLAEAFPADKYAWRPAPGVRSVGEVFMHVASEFYDVEGFRDRDGGQSRSVASRAASPPCNGRAVGVERYRTRVPISAERGDLMIVRTAERNFRVPAGLHMDPLSDPNDPWNFRRVSKTTWDIGLAHNEDFIGALHITIIRVWAILILAMIPWAVWVGNRWRKSQVGQDQRNNF